MTAEQQLAGFLARYDPAVARVARSARAKPRQLLPGAQELVYDNYNALVIGFGPDDRASQAVVSLALYPRWVTLFFLQGVRLEDPERLLVGSCARVRSIVLRDAKMLDVPAVKALVEAARKQQGGWAPRAPTPRTVVKSVSPRQRARRPSR